MGSTCHIETLTHAPDGPAPLASPLPPRSRPAAVLAYRQGGREGRGTGATASRPFTLGASFAAVPLLIAGMLAFPVAPRRTTTNSTPAWARLGSPPRLVRSHGETRNTAGRAGEDHQMAGEHDRCLADSP